MSATSESMEASYRRDQDARRLLDDAARAIEALRRRDRAWALLSREAREGLAASKREMERESAHIVAVWD